MTFQNLIENPQEATIELTILGLLFTRDLDAVDAGILGRILFYLGEVVITISVLMAAYEAKEKQAEAKKESKETTDDKTAITKDDIDSIRAILGKLQRQNQCLQEQIWALQENENTRK